MSDRHQGATLRANSANYSVPRPVKSVGRKLIGSYLVEAGLIAPAQVEVALYDQQLTGMRFGEILAARGWVKQETIEFFMERVAIPSCETTNLNSLPLRKSTQAKHAPTDLQNAMLSRRRPIAKSTILATAVDDEVKWVG